MLGHAGCVNRLFRDAMLGHSGCVKLCMLKYCVSKSDSTFVVVSVKQPINFALVVAPFVPLP